MDDDVVDIPAPIAEADEPYGSADDARPARQGHGRPKGKKGYTDTQMDIIVKGKEQGYGPKMIVENNLNAGLTEVGVKSVLRRYEVRGDTSRKIGTGQRRTARTAENVAQEKDILDCDDSTSLSKIARKSGLKRTAVQDTVKKDLKLKNYAKVKMRRVLEGPRQRRLELCKTWKEKMDDGYALGPRTVFFTDEKYFRIGSSPGGAQNYKVWVSDSLKKGEVPLEKIRIADGVFQGGPAVMVALGVSWNGIGTLRAFGQNTRMNAAAYLDVLGTTYLPDRERIFGGGEYVFTQDGASIRRSDAAQEYCRENIKAFWNKNQWPPGSPDLNALDFFAWSRMQDFANEEAPTTRETLTTAIREAAAALPLTMVRKVVDSWHKRVSLCVDENGMQFKHRLNRKIVGFDPPPRPGLAPIEDGDDLLRYDGVEAEPDDMDVVLDGEEMGDEEMDEAQEGETQVGREHDDN